MGRQGSRWHVRGFETATHFRVTLLGGRVLSTYLWERFGVARLCQHAVISSHSGQSSFASISFSGIAR